MDPEVSQKLDMLRRRQSVLASQAERLVEESLCIDKALTQLREQIRSTEQSNTTHPKEHLNTSNLATEPLVTEADCTPPPLPSSFTQKSSPPPQPPKKTSPSPSKEVNKRTPYTSSISELELNFGKTWLVRLGIVSLLTGLIFLSTYAYKNWLFAAPAYLKVCCFMLLSLGLTGAGLYFEKAKENLKNYWRVVSAGGLAAGYYTLYAAHFVESLQCILNSVVAGALLTAWAAMMLGYASWKRSQTISIMAIGLAFYGTIVNPAGWLSLFSAILLSVSGMFLMLRHNWIKVGIATILTAFIAHAFWLGFYPQTISELTCYGYLASYWLLFSCATSRIAGSTLPQSTARWITAINNSSTWTLSVFTLPFFIDRPELGTISLGMGIGFLACAVASSQKYLWPRHLSSLYLYKGLFLITLGVIVETSGYYRFMCLAAEALVLLIASRRLQSFWLTVVSLVVYACSLFSTLYNIGNDTPVMIYGILAALSLSYAGIVRSSFQHTTNKEATIALFPATAAWFIIYFGMLRDLSPSYSLSLLAILAGTAWAIFLLLKKTLKFQDFAIFAPFVIILTLLTQYAYEPYELHFLAYATPILLLGCWFSVPVIQRVGVRTLYLEQVDDSESPALRWTFSLFTALSLFHCIEQLEHAEQIWLISGGAIAVASHLLYQWTQRISILIPCQFFHFIAIARVSDDYSIYGIIPFLWLFLHFILSEKWWGAHRAARCLIAITSSIALCTYTDHPEISLTVLGLALSAYAYWKKDPVLHVLGGLSTLVLAAVATVVPAIKLELIYYLPMLSFIVLAALPQFNISKASLKLYYILLKTFMLLLIFATASFHIVDHFDKNGLAICWALLAAALFSIGLAMQHRSYRLVGLLWLSASFIHIVTIDVMQLNTLGRILSFITIGLTLMALGYLYNRFQERIQKLL